MADSDATAPPPEVAPETQTPAVDLSAAAPEDAASEPAVPAPAPAQEEAAPEAAEGEGDHKRKLEDVDAGAEANGDGEDAKRARTDADVAGGSLSHSPHPPSLVPRV
jgi:far upstream element-binding protein